MVPPTLVTVPHPMDDLPLKQWFVVEGFNFSGECGRGKSREIIAARRTFNLEESSTEFAADAKRYRVEKARLPFEAMQLGRCDPSDRFERSFRDYCLLNTLNSVEIPFGKAKGPSSRLRFAHGLVDAPTMKTVAIIAAVLGLLNSVPLAQSLLCDEKMALNAEQQTDDLKQWNQVYSSFKRYAVCDDGTIAEGCQMPW